MTAEEILKLIGYDNHSITPTEKWIAKAVYDLKLQKEVSDQEIEKEAEQFAYDYHYPDSAAKGLKQGNGAYIEEAQETINIFTKSAKWMRERMKQSV